MRNQLLATALALALTLTLGCGNHSFEDIFNAISSSSNDSSSSISSPIDNGNTFTDSRDGKVYKKVTIGSETWMAENLNYNVQGSVCYNKQDSNCAKYGRLYSWDAAMKACPIGWSLPIGWGLLATAVGGGEIAGAKLKASSGWDINGNGTDDYGFSALPGGRYDGIDFYFVGIAGYWWTKTEYYDSFAHQVYIDYNSAALDGGTTYKGWHYSVRCVKD